MGSGAPQPRFSIRKMQAGEAEYHSLLCLSKPGHVQALFPRAAHDIPHIQKERLSEWAVLNDRWRRLTAGFLHASSGAVG